MPTGFLKLETLKPWNLELGALIYYHSQHFYYE